MAIESNLLGKELGGIGCYRFNSGNIDVFDFVQLRGDILNGASYSFDKKAVLLTSEFHCSNKIPLLFHTHPSGSISPSKQDRLISSINKNPGCVVTTGGMSCYAGNDDIPSFHAPFKSNRIIE